MPDAPTPPKYLLLDASVVAAYYLPEAATRFTKLAQRTTQLIDAVKANPFGQCRLLIPSICIPEVFSIFAKYRFGRWNPQVKKPIDDLRYWRVRLDLHHDIHNGRIIQQVDLSRYHILATDLIAPVDHHFEFYRQRTHKFRKRPMGAFDHTIIGMGIYLVKTRGFERVLLVTADRRMGHILGRARSVKPKTAAKLGLVRIASDLGLRYGPDIYPAALNLATAKEATLNEVFGIWPPQAAAPPEHKTPQLTTNQRTTLARLYRRVTSATSEALTYTDEFEVLYEAFVAQTGLRLTRNQVWRHLSNIRKRGDLPRRKQASRRAT